MQEVEAMCNRAIVINEGRQVYDGAIDDLKSKGNGSLDQAFRELTSEKQTASV